MSQARKIEDLSLDEYVSQSYSKSRILRTIAGFGMGTRPDMTRAKAWVAAQAELDALYANRPSLAEQNAMLAEMGLVCGVYAPDEPVHEYPSADCADDASQPAAMRVDRLIDDFERAYQYGVGGVYLNSPGARYRAQLAELDAARAADSATPRPPRIQVAA